MVRRANHFIDTELGGVMTRSVSTRFALVGLLLLSIAMPPSAALASNQGRAGINLGATSFLDGFGRPVEGFTYQAYLTYSTASAIYDAQGNEITAFHDPHIATLALLNQLSYFLPHTLFGETVRPAINFVLPVVMFDTSFGTPGPVLHDNGIGVGDLTFGPMFQFKPIMAGDRPVFSHRFEVDLIVPIGRYDPGKTSTRAATTSRSTRTGLRPCCRCLASSSPIRRWARWSRVSKRAKPFG
jgi:hypothetical protein